MLCEKGSSLLLAAALEDPLLGGAKDGTDLEEGEEGGLVQDKSFWASLLSLAISVPALVGS